ncbi:MAG: hypothetical protein KAG89_05920 [Fulvimarina manganoxydans]|uniref:hypothetical protein n=1 Tax=Fulvimarina manganoxydans TaxID=937218 RepID=UPI00111C6639|nr:hypothetical protein [Fulvimarina manganoxydans]MCK5931690.1 hypothetical protein [Fulvimarina manganoxydans]
MTTFIRHALLVCFLLGAVGHAKAVSDLCSDPLALDRDALVFVVTAADFTSSRTPAPAESSETGQPHNQHCKAAAVQACPPALVTLKAFSTSYSDTTILGSGCTPGLIDRPPIPSL